MWTDSRGTTVYGADALGIQAILDDTLFVHVDLTDHRISVADPDDVSMGVLADQLLPRLADHSGTLVLHAALVVGAKGAVAIAGPTGAGKSTLAAQLLHDGMSALTDDATVLTLAAKGVLARPTYRRLILREGPHRALVKEGRGMTCGGLVALLDELVDPPHTDRAGGEALIALFILDPALAEADIACMPLSPAVAAAALLANSFALDPTDPQRARTRLAQVAEVVSRLPVYKLTAPRRENALPRLSAMIRDLLSKELQ